METKDLGTVHPPKDLFLLVHVGTAKDHDGNEYEICVGANSAPVIEAKNTGKKYVFDWLKLLQHAIDHGQINK